MKLQLAGLLGAGASKESGRYLAMRRLRNRYWIDLVCRGWRVLGSRCFLSLFLVFGPVETVKLGDSPAFRPLAWERVHRVTRGNQTHQVTDVHVRWCCNTWFLHTTTIGGYQSKVRSRGNVGRR